MSRLGVERLGSEIRLAGRGLRSSPGYAAVAVALFTLGLGVNTTVFTVVRQLFFAPPVGVAQPQSLVRLDHFSKHGRGNGWSYPDYEFFRRQARSFSHLAAYAVGSEELTAHLVERPEPLTVVFCSGNYFDVLGAVPAAGRFFVADEDRTPPSQPAAVISYRLWQRAFTGGEQAIGSSLRLGEQTLTVVGVAPRGFGGVSPAEALPEVWLPIAVKPAFDPMFAHALVRDPAYQFVWLDVIGRLKPGIAHEVANGDLARVSGLLGEEQPDWQRDEHGAVLLPDFRYSADLAERLGNLVRLMAVVVGLVLAIAIINLSLLQLARATSRTSQAGIRLALGARRREILRLELLESGMLALCGGLGAHGVAFWSAGWLGKALPVEFPLRFAPDLTALAWSLGTASVVALASGLAPAFLVGRTDVTRVIKQSFGTRGWAPLRRGLGVAQIALAVALLAAALSFVASFRKANAVPLGFASEGRVAVRLGLREQGFDAARAHRLVSAAQRDLAAIPGVERVSSLQMLPFSGMWVSVVQAVGSTGKGTGARCNIVGPGFFESLKIPLLAGRSFTAEDELGAPAVAVVSRLAAEQLWPGAEAVGRELVRGSGPAGTHYTVVGVVPDLRYESLDLEMKPRVFLPAQEDSALQQNLVLETRLPEASLLREVEKVLLRLEPQLGIPRLRPLPSLIDRVLRPFRVGATLMSFFAALAVLLTMAGLYGVLAFEVNERRREIGVAMALGAPKQAVAWRVIRRGLLLSAFGIPLGALAAWWGSRFLATFLFQNEVGGAWGLVGAALLALVVVALAGALPAWRASRVDPVEMMREG